MKRLVVGICVYKTRSSTEEKTGVILEVEGKEKILSLPNLEAVPNVVTAVQIPNTPDMKFDFGFTPEARKALKESRRLALVAS